LAGVVEVEALAPGLGHSSYRELVLQAPHSVQWMKTPCTWPSLTCINKVPQFPHRKSIVSRLVSGTGGKSRGRANLGAFTNLNFR
jgi:hypothetical protein